MALVRRKRFPRNDPHTKKKMPKKYALVQRKMPTDRKKDDQEKALVQRKISQESILVQIHIFSRNDPHAEKKVP